MGTLVARVNTFVHDTQSSIPIGDTYIGIYFELLSHTYIYLSPKEDRQADRARVFRTVVGYRICPEEEGSFIEERHIF